MRLHQLAALRRANHRRSSRTEGLNASGYLDRRLFAEDSVEGRSCFPFFCPFGYRVVGAARRVWPILVHACALILEPDSVAAASRRRTAKLVKEAEPRWPEFDSRRCPLDLVRCRPCTELSTDSERLGEGQARRGSRKSFPGQQVGSRAREEASCQEVCSAASVQSVAGRWPRRPRPSRSEGRGGGPGFEVDPGPGRL